MKKVFFTFISAVVIVFLLGFYQTNNAMATEIVEGYSVGKVKFINNNQEEKKIGINGEIVTISSEVESLAYFKNNGTEYQFFYYGNEAPFTNDFNNGKIYSITTNKLSLEIDITELENDNNLPLFYFASSSNDLVLDEEGKVFFVARQIAENTSLDYYTPNFKQIYLGKDGYTINSDEAINKTIDFSVVSFYAGGKEVPLETKGLSFSKYILEIEEYIRTHQDVLEYKLVNEQNLWLSSSITFNYDLTWDLNGKQIYFDYGIKECIYVNDAKLIIEDSLNGGIIAATDTLDYYVGHLIELSGNSTLNLKGGTLYAKRYAVYTTLDSHVSINGCTIYAYTIIGADSGENTSERYLYFISGNLKSYGSFVFIMSNNVQKLYIVFGACTYESYTQDFAYLDTKNEVKNVLVSFTGTPNYIYITPSKPYSIRHSYFNIDDENYQGDIIAIDGFGFNPVVGDTYIYRGLTSQNDFYKHYVYINSQDPTMKDKYMLGLNTTEKALVLCEVAAINYNYDKNISIEELLETIPSKLPIGANYYLDNKEQYFISDGNLYKFLGFYADSNYENQIDEIIAQADMTNEIFLKLEKVEIKLSGSESVAYGKASYQVDFNIGDNYSYSWYLNGEYVSSGSNMITINTTNAGTSMQVFVVINGYLNNEEFSIKSEVFSTTVTKASIDISDMHWTSQTEFIYSGDSYEITLVNVPSELMVTYIDNKGIDAGTYMAVAKFSYDEANYNLIEDLTQEFTIYPKELIITIKDQELSYNQELIKYELSYDGFVKEENEDILNGQFTYDTTYYLGANAGMYYLYGKGLEAKNYTIKYNPGMLTVNKIKAQPIEVKEIEIMYNDELILSDIALPGGVHFVNPNDKVLEGKNTYQAYYNPNPTNYEDVEIQIVVVANAPVSPVIFIFMIVAFVLILIILYLIFSGGRRKNNYYPIRFYRK